ncbi:MAG: single-stranded DNA-binding protein [Eubacteriales bacterium]|nr:single-stranded DNA-binding protein [Christensenellaceae bacterium]MCI7769307.1 single-stranded DNA-binding protein [Christensenellaceae bacterium]MDD6360766.1 single-stranded DNA-binding protein [Christensenellaceae bacterium]MDD7091990.1 single-stranded DNA-binding protein [Christensenellaceae bacterium]MDY3241596.1 single-stranded DNA-binding protein [Eubacteriales bacterium]
MSEVQINNKVYLMGRVTTAPAFTHEVMGEGFYEILLAVKRMSEQEDIIPVTLSERLMIDTELKRGDVIAVEGQFRSYNKIEKGKSRLMLTVFVRDIVDFDEERNPNIIELTGYVCKPTVYRTTPFKREICDILIAVNRAYNKSDYIPCIAWGRNARFAGNLEVGDKITVTGRIQSREYQKNVDGETVQKTAYEVSINKIVVEDENRVFETSHNLDGREECASDESDCDA